MGGLGGVFGVQHLGCCLPGIPACSGVTGGGLATSNVCPFPSPSFIYSLDLSELAKAAKKKLQAVSLLGQAPDA